MYFLIDGAAEKEVDLSRANSLLKFQDGVGAHEEALTPKGALERFERGIFQGIPRGGHGHGGKSQPQDGAALKGAGGAAKERETERRRSQKPTGTPQKSREQGHRALPLTARKNRREGSEGEKRRDGRHEKAEDGPDDPLLEFPLAARLDHLFGVVEVVEDLDLVAGLQNEFGVVFRPEARLDFLTVRAREGGHFVVDDLNTGTVVAVDVAHNYTDLFPAPAF